jgi:hypothetical protein
VIGLYNVDGAYCAVRTECVNTFQVAFVFNVLNFMLVTVCITICLT